MSNAQIQIQFPTPGVWDKMTMTVVYEDADGYTHSVTYTQDKIPADQAPALASVVSALVGLAERGRPGRCGRGWNCIQKKLLMMTEMLILAGHLQSARKLFP